MRVVLLGATGAIGESIAAELRKRGESYRAVGRDRASLDRAFGSDPLAEIAIWNPDDPASVRAALRGADAAVYLVGVPYNHFELHPVLMRQTLDAAVAEGLQQMLLVGTVYPYGRAQTTPAREDHPREPHTFKGRMRKQQEDLLLEADAAGKIRGTVLRLPDFYGPRVKNSFLDSLFTAAATGGKVFLRDGASQTLYATLKNGDQLWANDARLVQTLIEVVKSLGVKRVALWRLGQEDPGIWDVLR